MASSDGAFFKELDSLIRNIHNLSNGQATIAFNPDIDERVFHVYITPNDGHYMGATCKFKVDASEPYPKAAPSVFCMNSIYHPNIDYCDEWNYRDSVFEASVCVNLLNEDWQPHVGLDGTVMALLYLFHNPNFNDTVNPAFEGNEVTDEEFRDNIRASLRGGLVGGLRFDKLIWDDDENLQNDVKDASVRMDTESESTETSCDEGTTVKENEHEIAETAV